MPIAFDNVGSYTPASTASGTFSFNNNGNFIGVGIAGDTTDNIGTVTYAGGTLTKVVGTQVSGPDRFIYLYYIVSPATGVNNLIINANNATFIDPIIVSYNNTIQISPIDGSTITTQSNGTSLAGTVTTTVDNDWSLAYYRTNTTQVLTAGANTTIRATNGTVNNGAILDTNGPKTPAGAVILSATSAGTCFSGLLMASFSPSKGAGLTTHSKFWGA